MIKIRIRNADHEIDIRFPISESELFAKLGEIHAVEGRDAAQSALVTEVYWPEEFSMLKDHFANLDELNYLGKRMESFDTLEYDQFLIGISKLGYKDVKDLINLTFNLNHFTLCQDVSSYGKIGREYLLTVKGCLPADDEDDPKYAEFGRKLIQSGKGVFTEHGLLFVDESTPFQKLYDGQVFPPYVYDSDVLCIARADYNGKSEYLYLPCEEKAIDKALARLGAAPENAKITLEDFSVNNPKWFERFKRIAADEGVYELNRLANAINSADTDLKKLWLVAEYAEVEEAGQLARLAENIGCFKVIEDVSDYEDVGRYVVDNNDCYALHPELEDYFDFNGFGEHIAEEYGGKFVDGNFIYNDTDTDLSEILYQDEPITMEGM